MKQTLTLVALGALLAIPAVQAQDNPKKDAPKQRQPGAGGFGGGLRGGGIAGLDQLDLTAEQKEKVAAIQKAQAEKMQALSANQDTPREERTAKMTALRADTTKQVKALLTKEQSEKFDKIQAAAPNTGAGGFGGGGFGGIRGGVAGLDKLDLTAEQKTKVEAIQKEQREKLQALFQDQNTPREERATKMRELMQGIQTQIEAVLTAEQKKKLEEIRKNTPAPNPGRRPGGKTTPEKA